DKNLPESHRKMNTHLIDTYDLLKEHFNLNQNGNSCAAIASKYDEINKLEMLGDEKDHKKEIKDFSLILNNSQLQLIIVETGYLEKIVIPDNFSKLYLFYISNTYIDNATPRELETIFEHVVFTSELILSNNLTELYGLYLANTKLPYLTIHENFTDLHYLNVLGSKITELNIPVTVTSLQWITFTDSELKKIITHSAQPDFDGLFLDGECSFQGYPDLSAVQLAIKTSPNGVLVYIECK
ncbi:MAG: hypothetical protein K2X39_08790, partial [Silvanigrellaceae bacterium]|nr:hypothetical protein [Silvanigrellaceae bacterium]